MNLCMSIIPPVVFLLILFGGWEAYCQINEIPVWKLPKPTDIISAFFYRISGKSSIFGKHLFQYHSRVHTGGYNWTCSSADFV